QPLLEPGVEVVARPEGALVLWDQTSATAGSGIWTARLDQRTAPSPLVEVPPAWFSGLGAAFEGEAGIVAWTITTNQEDRVEVVRWPAEGGPAAPLDTGA